MGKYARMIMVCGIALATSWTPGSILHGQDRASATKKTASPFDSSPRAEQRGFAQTSGPYSVLTRVKVGGNGGFDYVYADSTSRKLYIPRLGVAGRITVFDLDTLKPLGEIPNSSAHGVTVDSGTSHGFGSSQPVVMWDTNTLATIRTITVQGNPDGIFDDAINGHIYILSHSAPNATVINARDGSIVGTINLGGLPEQAVSDGKGHIYINIEDEDNIAVIDAKALAVTAHYDLAGKGDDCSGLAIDAKNGILFAACNKPHTMVILNANNGTILDTLPISRGSDGAVFNPNTMEAFSSQPDGTLTVVKEISPTRFAVEQTVQTLPYAKTLTLDSKTNHILLITAEAAPQPTPTPGGHPRRPTMLPGSFTILVVGK